MKQVYFGRRIPKLRNYYETVVSAIVPQQNSDPSGMLNRFIAELAVLQATELLAIQRFTVDTAHWIGPRIYLAASTDLSTWKKPDLSKLPLRAFWLQPFVPITSSEVSSRAFRAQANDQKASMLH